MVVSPSAWCFTPGIIVLVPGTKARFLSRHHLFYAMPYFPIGKMILVTNPDTLFFVLPNRASPFLTKLWQTFDSYLFQFTKKHYYIVNSDGV